MKPNGVPLILKLRLPYLRSESKLDEENCEIFNDFYSSLAMAYRDSLGKLASGNLTRTSISVDFSVVSDKCAGKYRRLLKNSGNLTAFERFIKSDMTLSFAADRHVDLWDLKRGILLK